MTGPIRSCHILPLLGLAAALGFCPVAVRASLVPDDIFPPWQHGRNNDATKRGLEFTVPEVDDLANFHGDITDPRLVLYVGGNYFFAMAPLVEAFEQAHPDYRGRLCWERSHPACWSSRSRPAAPSRPAT